MTIIDTIDIAYSYSEEFSWLISRFPFPSFMIFLFLLTFFIWNLLTKTKNWLTIRKQLINAIKETQVQAIAHQDTSHPVDHALEPHKREKTELIIFYLEQLPNLDPLKGEVLNLVEKLKAANSFEQSEKITEAFLKQSSSSFPLRR